MNEEELAIIEHVFESHLERDAEVYATAI